MSRDTTTPPPDDGTSLQVAFARWVAVITLAAVILELELAPRPLTRAPHREDIRIRVPPTLHNNNTQHPPPPRPSLPTVPLWEPSADYNTKWIRKSVANMLLPWSIAGVDPNFTAHLDDWAISQRKKHCWGVVQIHNMQASRTGCVGNGRYDRSISCLGYQLKASIL